MTQTATMLQKVVEFLFMWLLKVVCTTLLLKLQKEYKRLNLPDVNIVRISLTRHSKSESQIHDHMQYSIVRFANIHLLT